MKAGSFKPVTDAGLGQGVRKFLDALHEDRSGLCRVPFDLGPYPAVTKEGEDHVYGVQVVVDLAGHDHFGEVVDFFSQDLFGDAFIIGLVCIKFKIEGHGQEEGHADGALVFDGCVKGWKSHPVQFELTEESPLDCENSGVVCKCESESELWSAQMGCEWTTYYEVCQIHGEDVGGTAEEVA